VRVLAATTAGAGHLAGLLPFARACVRAGHEVRLAAPRSFAGTVADAGLVHQPLADADPAALGAVFGRVPGLSMREADDLVVAEVFGRLDRDAALPGMRAAFEEFRPDAVLREPAELASYVVATEHGVPHVQTSTGLSVLEDRLLPLVVPTLDEVGCPSAGLLSAPRWTVVPPSFDLPAAAPTGTVTHACAPRADRGDEQSLPDWWSRGDDRPLTYVTFGSVAAGIGLFPALYARVLEQLADLPTRVLLTLGQAGDPAALGPVPDDVHVERWWPQDDVLPRAAVVVGHGGFGTTQAALEAGVPQVVLPLFSFDQFQNAHRVAATGVGLALVDRTDDAARAGDLVPRALAAADGLRSAVSTVLEQRRYRDRAGALVDEIDSLQSTDACVATLRSLCG
jgi:UDP:flavonoid glycosyltransferase YjiC (YdhE family)